ncbi:hypothetical protein MBLNU457_g0979t1 [Dothideomycetes sp. NU457]
MPLRRRHTPNATSSKKKLRYWEKTSRGLVILAIFLLLCLGTSSVFILLILAIMLWQYVLSSAAAPVPFVGLATAASLTLSHVFQIILIKLIANRPFSTWSHRVIELCRAVVRRSTWPLIMLWMACVAVAIIQTSGQKPLCLATMSTRSGVTSGIFCLEQRLMIALALVAMISIFGLAIYQANGYDLSSNTYSRHRLSDPRINDQDSFDDKRIQDEENSPTNSIPEFTHILYDEKEEYNYRSSQRRSVSQNMALLAARPSLHTLRSSIVASSPPPKHPLPPLPPYRPGHLSVPVSAPALRSLPQRPPRVHRLHPAYHRTVGQGQSVRMNRGSLSRTGLSLPPPAMIKRPESSVYSRDVSGDGKEVGGRASGNRYLVLSRV